MDVKYGNGAFMDSFEKAKVLAENIVRVATAAKTPTTALLTDMNQVLGTTAGNAVEVVEAVEFLLYPAKADKRLLDITLDLAEHMLILSGAQTEENARAQAEEGLKSGKAAEIFGKMVAAQGGPADFMDKYQEYLVLAPVVKPVPAARSGFVSGMDTRAIGMAVVALGGGRIDPAQKIDHSVGLTEICQVGDAVEQDGPLAVVYARDEAAADEAIARVQHAVHIADAAPKMLPVTTEIIRG
jgi:thymidine phosphorylase